MYHRRSARHVHMRLVHMVAGLSLYPAGVKSTPFADKHHRLGEARLPHPFRLWGSRTSPTCPPVLHHNKPRLVFGSLADAQDRAHTELLHFFYPKYFHRELGACPASFRCGLSRSSKLLRGHISAGGVRKLAGRIDLARDNQTVGKTLPAGRQASLSIAGGGKDSKPLDKIPTVLRLGLVRNMFVVGHNKSRTRHAPGLVVAHVLGCKSLDVFVINHQRLNTVLLCLCHHLAHQQNKLPPVKRLLFTISNRQNLSVKAPQRALNKPHSDGPPPRLRLQFHPPIIALKHNFFQQTPTTSAFFLFPNFR